jgi:23S rRNA (cytosine1962-C5)-methyltransferase
MGPGSHGGNAAVGNGPTGRGVALEQNAGTVTLKAREDKRIRSGHLWIFSNEIADVDGTVDVGDTVSVRDARGHLLGTGYMNPHSLIAVRLVSRSRVEISREFLTKRITTALRYRERIRQGDQAYRVIYGDADLLPGLIVDRYGECLVVQSLTAGIERRLDVIVEILMELLGPRAIVLRNDSPMRSYEGLAVETRVAHGKVAEPVSIEQDGHRFLVDVLDGQKTGFFLDQRDNRRATAPLAEGLDVLDCCSYTCAWSVYAAGAGAKSITAIDTSAPALSLGRRNLEINRAFDRASLVKGDVFKELAKLSRGRRLFGLVILDPPAFAKSRKRVREALKAYRTVNRMAMSITRAGGHVVTSKCSHLVDRESFLNALVGAAKESGRRARVLEIRGQAPDHPVVLGFPETDYLTCVVLEVL